ncbi:MAG: hypothetical protein AAGA58_03310 [Verrucomicrobiota bacterium]
MKTTPLLTVFVSFALTALFCRPAAQRGSFGDHYGTEDGKGTSWGNLPEEALGVMGSGGISSLKND